MRTDYTKHNAWVRDRLEELRAALVANDRPAIDRLSTVICLRIPNHGNGSDGFGTNETDLRYHLNRLSIYLYGDGDKREGVVNFISRKERKLDLLNKKLRDVNRRISQGRGTKEDMDNQVYLSQDIQRTKVQIEQVRDKTYPSLMIFSLLEAEATKRGIKPRVETVPDSTPVTAPVVPA